MVLKVKVLIDVSHPAQAHRRNHYPDDTTIQTIKFICWYLDEFWSKGDSWLARIAQIVHRCDQHSVVHSIPEDPISILRTASYSHTENPISHCFGTLENVVPIICDYKKTQGVV